MLIVYYKCFYVSKIPFNSTLTYVILILTLRVYLKKRYLLNKKAVVEKSIAVLEQNVILLTEDEGVDEATRLNAAINGILGFVSQRNDFIDFLHQDINAVMHAKLEKATVERIVPILSDLVAKGNAKGCFNIENPTETVEFLSTALVYIFHQPDINTDQQRREKLCQSLETILNKVLLAKNYSFMVNI